MEESTRKVIALGVIVVCLVLAGVITCKTSLSKGPDLRRFEDKTTLVKCRNPDCKAVYQVNVKDYFEYTIKHKDPGIRGTPPLICRKCGKPSVYRAIKCEKCGFIFELGSIPRNFEDRCPRCGYSKIEHDRKVSSSAGGE